MDMYKDKDFLQRLCKGIAAQFGNNCEVVVHDMSKSYEETIVAIENGYITRREVGDGGSEIVLKTLKAGGKAEDQLNYMTKTPDGKILNSSSIYIRDGEGNITGILSINFNITDLLRGEAALASLINKTASEEKQEDVDTIPNNVQDLLENLIQEACELIGKPVAIMNKDDKTRAIQYLDSKGTFLIKKSGDRVSEHFGISKYTLYNYLDSPRGD